MAGLFCTVVSLRSLSASDDIIKAASPQSVAKPNRRIDVANNQRLNRSCIFLIICSISLWSSNEWDWADIHYSQRNMKNIPHFSVCLKGWFKTEIKWITWYSDLLNQYLLIKQSFSDNITWQIKNKWFEVNLKFHFSSFLFLFCFCIKFSWD